MVQIWVAKRRRRFTAAAVAALGVFGTFGALAASNLPATTPPAAATESAPGGTGDCTSLQSCYTPQQLEVAYGVEPLLQRGIDGRGETVVLPELAESQLSPPTVTDLRLDFAAFDRLFHLPAPSLKVVSTFPNPSHPWFAFGEEVLDAEIVHAIAPRASLTILLVKETSLDSPANAVAASVAALRLGASEGGVISISAAGQIGGEHCVDHAQVTQLNAALEDDTAHHVTVIAATGDVGATGEPCVLITALSGTSRINTAFAIRTWSCT
jgi:subtilase family serine protease